MTPTRYVISNEARRKHGARVARFGQFFAAGDQLADEAIRALQKLSRPEREATISRAIEGAADVPDQLRLLVASVSQMPVWWDPVLAQRGGDVITRAGLGGGFVLAFKCLMTSYCSTGGNKPLVFSGRLEEDTFRRLQETGRFVQAMADPQGLKPGTDPFRAALRVRLVHAQVRAFLMKSEKWRREDWGVAINQADMAGTALLFSHVFLEGLDQLGLNVTTREREAVLHLWRGVGFLLGVEQELLCANGREAKALWDLIMDTQAEADDDSRRLAQALLNDQTRQARTPADKRRARVAVKVQLALTRAFIGPELSRQLRLKSSPLQLGMPVLTRLISTVNTGMKLTGVSEFFSRRAGELYWRQAIGSGFSAIDSVFGVPTQLGRL